MGGGKEVFVMPACGKKRGRDYQSGCKSDQRRGRLGDEGEESAPLHIRGRLDDASNASDRR